MPTPSRFRNVERWGGVSQLLHWTVVILILVAMVGAVVMARQESAAKGKR